ncbi:uncharacterized protein APUU_70978A [Aspergillus puulaauensis]|uniref:Uncharacterized protein n=1 Tax=Aspergillus puulaauensis TaxID=1220207 RepID=A0A7R8ATZ5_9EURO|nr:uncharacterized protein APUU_70978A [Aspergillus puulaauensis]BCS29408.1 hypothetical protein APUU_70978A [Aspergillus puulaauensis]
MSDNEEYYDEFDDDDIFWIEEADPTAADDLAAAATYDPNFLDDPSLETAEFYSDWEDLSDDYYDEDPTAVRRLRAMGAWPTQEPIDINALPTKRRKVTNNISTDSTSFQGVAWKHPEDKTNGAEIYAPGDGEKVSLLKNWREVFRNAKPAIARLQGRIPQPKASGTASREQSESDLDVPSLVEDICEDEIISSDAPSAKSYSGSVNAQGTVDLPSKAPAHSHKGGPKNLNDNTVDSTKEEDRTSTTSRFTTDAKTEKKTKESTTPRGGRKRKASVSVDEQPDQSKNTKPKAKRAATSKTSGATNPPPAPASPVRRSARQRK